MLDPRDSETVKVDQAVVKAWRKVKEVLDETPVNLHVRVLARLNSIAYLEYTELSRKKT